MLLSALVSGGKDSVYAMYLAMKSGHEIKNIISVMSENAESYMFHTHNIDLVKEQANLMGIPIVEKHTKGVKEEELDDLKQVISEQNVDGVVTGAVESNYQFDRIEKICNDLGIESIAPLWHIDQKQYMLDMINEGFESIIVSVAAPPLDEKWLGRCVDEKFVDEIVKLNKDFGISIVGEGGEYDTLVINCPMFRKGLLIEESKTIWDTKTRSGFMVVNAKQ
ncbi:diphthine--ammonia ligase [archaeon]|nr:diphthine--ammonia ligase [archaeon]